GGVIIFAALWPSGAGRTSADTTNCRVARWKTCWTARQSSVLPSPTHSTRHAAGAPSGACSARADCAAAIKMVSAITTAVVSAHLPAAEAWRLAGIWAKLLDCAEMGRSAVAGAFKARLGLFGYPFVWSLRAPGRPNTLPGNSPSRWILKEIPVHQRRVENMNIRETAPRLTELEKFSTRTDTRDYLAKAAP